MPAKKQSKPRTSKSKLNKKSKVPNWVIGLVLMIVVGTGAFLVYNSFAGTNYPIVTVWCSRGQCYDKPGGDRRPRQAYIRSGPVCMPSIYGQVGYMDLADTKKRWSCLNGNVQ
ncbi:MAG TPA: hypothetical protein PJ993_03030 [Candidatus Saccharibacteria bacterium]|nr:hypothetical protein [Candidatus Saccharibacteria bacterium]HMT39878.1 hypothetical protein [Candidatus Saccharibacteria bacterium]